MQIPLSQVIIGKASAAGMKQNRTRIKLIVLAILAALVLLIAFFAPFIVPYDPYDQNLSAALQEPNAQHWAGTDRYGRDLFSRIIYGSPIVSLRNACLSCRYHGYRYARWCFRWMEGRYCQTPSSCACRMYFLHSPAWCSH